MSTLRPKERRQLEELFRMNGGYVLEFSDSSFRRFILEASGVDIDADAWDANGTSKANRLRLFWEKESDPLVGKVLLELIEMREEEGVGDDDQKLLEKCKGIAERLLAAGPALESLKMTGGVRNSRQLQEQVARLYSSVDEDPALAIGTAKEMIETCCQTILGERGTAIPGNPTVPQLVKAVCKELDLVPGGVPKEKKGAETIKRLLSNLSTVATGLAELRNLYGTGHGKQGNATGLTPRHARLAVGAAATLTIFLFDTHKDRS